MTNDPQQAYASFRPAWRAFAVYFFGVAVFWLGPIINPEAPIGPGLSQLLGTLFAAFILIKRFTCLYQVGQGTINLETTFPARKSLSVPVAQIRRIDLRRGAIQRLLDVAHVHIYVEGQEGAALKLFGVPKPLLFRQVLLDMGAQDQQRVTGAWRR